MAKLVVRKGRNAGAEHPIPPEKTRVVIGRSDKSDIQVLDAQASRKHAEIAHESGRFTLRDLKSGNGTRLNGRLVEREARLKFGDKILIGETVYQFVPEPEEVAAEDFEKEAEAASSPAESETEQKILVADEELPAGFAEKKTAMVAREELEKRARARAAQEKVQEKVEDEKPPAGSPQGDAEENLQRRPARKPGKRKASASRPPGARVGWWKGLPLWAKAVAVLGLIAAAVAFFAAAILVGLRSTG